MLKGESCFLVQGLFHFNNFTCFSKSISLLLLVSAIKNKWHYDSIESRVTAYRKLIPEEQEAPNYLKLARGILLISGDKIT